MTLYAVSVSTIQTTDAGKIHRQSPTFILNSDAQGILNERDAEHIARRIVNPTGNPAIKVNATAVKWRTLD